MHGLYNDLQSHFDGEISALFFPHKSCTASLTPEGGEAWLVSARSPNQEPLMGVSARNNRRLLRLRHHTLVLLYFVLLQYSA